MDTDYTRADPSTSSATPPDPSLDDSDGLQDVFGARHVLRDLCTTTEQISATHSVSVTPLADHLRDQSGAPALSVLATLADVNASLVALVASRPDWTATVSLGLRAARTGRQQARGPIVAEARLERAGSKIVVLQTRLYDGAGASADEILDRHRAGAATAAETLLAAGVVTFARIPASASRASGRFDPLTLIGHRRRPDPVDAADDTPAGDGDPGRSLAERVGWTVIDAEAGVVELVATPYVRNSFGAVTGGVHAMLMQAAAEAVRPDAEVVGLDLHFLAQARQGHLRTSVERLRTGQDGAGPDRADANGVEFVEVRLADDGGTGATVTLGHVTLAPRPMSIRSGDDAVG